VYDKEAPNPSQSDENMEKWDASNRAWIFRWLPQLNIGKIGLVLEVVETHLSGRVDLIRAKSDHQNREGHH